MLIVGVALAFVALVSWTGTTLGDCMLDFLAAMLRFDGDAIARWLWRIAIVVLVVGSVGKLATEGL